MLPELALMAVQQFDPEMRKHLHAQELVLFPVLSEFRATGDLVRSLRADVGKRHRPEDQVPYGTGCHVDTTLVDG